MLVPVKSEKDELKKKKSQIESDEHEIDTRANPQMEMMSDEHFQKICNPAGYAFKEALDAFEKEQNEKILEQITMILLLDDAQYNSQVHAHLPRLISYLSQDEFHDKIVLILSDIAHLNEKVVNILLELDIFEKIDYTKRISFSLILSICDSNKVAFDIFMKTYFKPEFKEIQSIKILLNNNES